MAKSFELPDPHVCRVNDLEMILADIQKIIFIEENDDGDDVVTLTPQRLSAEVAQQVADRLISAGLGPQPASSKPKGN